MTRYTTTPFSGGDAARAQKALEDWMNQPSEFDMSTFEPDMSWEYEARTDDGELHKAVRDAWVTGVNYGDLGRTDPIYDLALMTRNALTDSIARQSKDQIAPSFVEIATHHAVVGTLGYLQLYHPVDRVFDVTSGDLLIAGSGIDEDCKHPEDAFDILLGWHNAALKSKGLVLKDILLSGPKKAPYAIWSNSEMK